MYLISLIADHTVVWIIESVGRPGLYYAPDYKRGTNIIIDYRSSKHE